MILRTGQAVRWPPAPLGIAQIVELRRTHVRICYQTRTGLWRFPIVRADRIQPDGSVLFNNLFARGALPRERDYPPPIQILKTEDCRLPTGNSVMTKLRDIIIDIYAGEPITDPPGLDLATLHVEIDGELRPIPRLGETLMSGRNPPLKAMLERYRIARGGIIASFWCEPVKHPPCLGASVANS